MQLATKSSPTQIFSPRGARAHCYYDNHGRGADAACWHWQAGVSVWQLSRHAVFLGHATTRQGSHHLRASHLKVGHRPCAGAAAGFICGLLGVITGHLRCGTTEAPDHAHLLPACYARDIVPVVCLAFVVACALALARRPAAAQVMRPFVTDFGRLAGCVASPSPARRCCCCRRRCCCSSWCWCYACVILCVRDLVRARTRYDER